MHEKFPQFHAYAKEAINRIEFIQNSADYGHRRDFCTIIFNDGEVVTFRNVTAAVIYNAVRDWTVAEFPNSNVTRYYP